MELKNQNIETIANKDTLDFLDAVASILASALGLAVIFTVIAFLIIFIVSLVFDRDGR